MLLNSTMKLGYLEGSMLDDLGIRAESRRPTLKLDEKGFEVSGPRPSRTSLRPGSNQSQRGFQKETLNSLSRSTSKDRPASQGRVSLKGTRENKLQRSFSREASLNPSTPGAVEEPGPSWQALEWTRPPQKDVRREGASVYSVSTPATQGAREHQPHLVRTTRIEPAAKGYANKRPPVPPKKAEQIVVTEKDLRRCGSDLQKLRECSISTPSKPMEVVMKPAPVEETQKFELSFKSNFAKICRESADPRDPWEGVGHPDELRELTVEDLVLNQVYIHALSPRKIEFDVNSSPEQGTRKPKLLRSASASTRASSADVALQTWPTDDRREGFSRRVPRVRPRPGLPPAGGKRASSVPRDSMEGAEGGKATRPEGQGAIQPISTDTPRTAREDETPPHKRAMRSFLKGAASRGETRAVWLALDRDTGEVQVFKKEAGERLEAAFRTGRTSVPLAGLEDALEGAIVAFDKTSQSFAHVRHMDGTEADVQRFEVTAYSSEMAVGLVGPPHGGNAWRFAKDDETCHERLLPLLGTELVSPPSPTLPPVSRNRQVYYINAGADWAGSDSY